MPSESNVPNESDRKTESRCANGAGACCGGPCVARSPGCASGCTPDRAPDHEPEDEPVADLVPAPEMALSEFEFHTKNALAVAMLSASDRRALGALGYFAIETAALRPLMAWGVNSIHRDLHALAARGVSPMALWEMLNSGRLKPEKAEGVSTTTTDTELDVIRYTLPDAYVAEVRVPATLSQEDFSVIVPANSGAIKRNVVAIELTRPPRTDEEMRLSDGLDIFFKIDADVHQTFASLRGNLLTLRVPRKAGTRLAVASEP